jgi:hypothetical protein
MARSPASPIHQRPPPYNLGLFIMFVPDYAVISTICHTATSRCGYCGRGQLPKMWARQTKNINVLTKHTLTKTHVSNVQVRNEHFFVFFVFGLKIVIRKPQRNFFGHWIVHRQRLLHFPTLSSWPSITPQPSWAITHPHSIMQHPCKIHGLYKPRLHSLCSHEFVIWTTVSKMLVSPLN